MGPEELTAIGAGPDLDRLVEDRENAEARRGGAFCPPAAAPAVAVALGEDVPQQLAPGRRHNQPTS